MMQETALKSLPKETSAVLGVIHNRTIPEMAAEHCSENWKLLHCFLGFFLLKNEPVC